jgi:hypothetical protein
VGLNVRLVLDVLLPRRYVCALIDWLRPGTGHKLTDRCTPAACIYCGSSSKGT